MRLTIRIFRFSSSFRSAFFKCSYNTPEFSSPADHASARRVPVRLCPHHAVPVRCLDVSRSRLVVSINTGLSDTTRPTPTTGEDAGVIDAGGVEKIAEEDDAI